MLAIEADSVKIIAVAIVVGLLLLAALAVKMMVNGTKRLIVLVLAAGLIVAVWSQRASLQNCADTLKEESGSVLEGTKGTSGTCTFFGFDVSVDLPDRPG